MKNLFRLKSTIYLLFIVPLLGFGISQIDRKFNTDVELLKKVQKKYNSSKNIYMSFTQTGGSLVSEMKQSLKGNLFYSKGNKYKIELKDQIIICDGKTVWNYSKLNKRVIITNYEENFFSPSNLLVKLPEKAKIQFLGEERIDNNKYQKVQFNPTDEELNFKYLIIWIAEDLSIRKVYTEDWAGNIYSYIIDKISFNEKFNEDIFYFTIPKGEKVIDLR